MARSEARRDAGTPLAVIARWRPRGVPPRWPVTIALLAGLGSAVGSLGAVFEENSWWFAAMGVAALVMVATVLLRAVIRLPMLASVGGLAVLLFALTIGFAPGAAYLGFVPNGEVFGAFVALVADGMDSIGSQGVPALPVRGIVFLLTLGTGLLAILLDLGVAAARPAFTGLPLLAVLLVPTFFLPGAGHPFFFCLTAACYLVVLYIGVSEARAGGAIGIGAAAAVFALLLPLVLPPVASTEEAGADGGLTVRTNFLISLGDNLRQPVDAEVLSYVTESGQGEYLRLVTIDILSGSRWLPAGPTTNPDLTVDEVGPVPGLDPDRPTRDIRASIVIANLRGYWLPVPYAPRSITGADEDWSYNPLTLEITSAQDSALGETYEVLSQRPVLSAAALRATGVDPGDGLGASLPRSLLVPPALRRQVSELTAPIIAGATTNFDKAVALEDHFRLGDYEYSESAPVEQGYDGTNVGVISEFLERKSGYCVHFAAAMAIMARSAGIPSRMAVGFTPGEWIEPAEGRDGYYSVTTHDLHSWPELWFDGYGWVRFEPTPTRGEPVSFAQEFGSQGPVGTPAPTAGPTGAPTATASPTPTPTPSFDPSTAAKPLDLVVPVVVIGLLLAVAFAVVLLPALRRRLRHWRRLWRVRRHGSAADAWSELVDTAIDIGWDVGTATPRQFATRLRRTLAGDISPALDRLLAAIEATAYSPTSGLALAADLDALRNHLLSLAPWRERLYAVFSPPSVVRPWTEADRQPAPRMR